MCAALPCLRLSFSFSGAGAARGLHSFPTRRSSDLTPFGETADAPGGSAVFFSAAGAILHPVQDGAGGAEEQDRKSTRLNSSHTVISYAVFCLKKKKRHR